MCFSRMFSMAISENYYLKVFSVVLSVALTDSLCSM